VNAGSPPEFESRRADWLAVAEAQRRILAAATPLDEERVPLLDSLGRALAEDVTARTTLPPWDNSAMDGYAARSEDVRGASPEEPKTLRVIGLVRAGETHDGSVGEGEAIRIMTGAPLPAGCDSVVRVEDTDGEAEPGTVHVYSDRDAGRNVRPGGEDMRAGDRVLERGTNVHVGAIAVLAALGRTHTLVHRRPRVAILTTGDELRTPDRFEDVLAGRGVPESNGPMLAAAVLAAGGDPVSLGVAPDDAEAVRRGLRRGREADVLVTVGGASMGEADLVKRVLDGEGFRQEFWRVQMRPGSPFGFGWLPATRPQPVFSLPGNPSSAFVTFELFVRPFLRRLAGHTQVHRPRLRCTVDEPLTGAADLEVYLRVTVDARQTPPTVRTTGPQGSGLVRGLGSAGGLAILPLGVAALAAGEEVDVILVDGERAVVPEAAS